MITPAIFAAVLVGMILSALIFAVAFICTLRFFHTEDLEFQPLFFISLIAHFLIVGMAYLINLAIARSGPAMRNVVVGNVAIPTSLIGIIWLVLLGMIFTVIMVKIAGGTTFLRSVGAVWVGSMMVFIFVVLAGGTVCLALDYPPEEIPGAAIKFFTDLPDMLDGDL